MAVTVWKGHLTFGLVSIPVRLARAARRETIGFHQLYRAEPSVCNVCPVKASCTASPHGRTVHRSLYEAYLERVHAYHQTPAFEKAMTKRRVWVETPFAEAKQWHHLDKFRLRGRKKVNIEGLLVAAGQNLKRWLQATG